MTAEQERNLARVAVRDGLRIFSPTPHALERYAPLEVAGWVTIATREGFMDVTPTAAGRIALKNYKAA